MIKDDRDYSSEIPEEQLAQLWEKLKNQFPVLYDKFMNHDYQGKDSDEELRGRDGGLQVFLQKELPNLPPYPDTYVVYSDMKIYFDRNLRK